MIEIRNISKTFKDGTKALDNVSLHIDANEIVILKGKSGSGKSTLLSILAALLKPSSGDILIDAKSITKLPDRFASAYRREKVGFIFQKFHLIPTLNVYENIATALIPLNLSTKQIDAKVQKVMAQFNIHHKQHTKTSMLSGGEQQRVAIARAMVNDPEILIADEPTANLDDTLAKAFLDFIHQTKGSRTILIATHDAMFFEQGFREVSITHGKIDA